MKIINLSLILLLMSSMQFAHALGLNKPCNHDRECHSNHCAGAKTCRLSGDGSDASVEQ